MTKLRDIELAREVGFNTEHAATNEYLHQFAQRVRAEAALDKKAENARELGLDYEPVHWIENMTIDSTNELNRPTAPVQAEKQEPWVWQQAPIKTQWGHDMVVADLAIDKDHTVSVYCERDQTEKVEAMFNGGRQ